MQKHRTCLYCVENCFPLAEMSPIPNSANCNRISVLFNAINQKSEKRPILGLLFLSLRLIRFSGSITATVSGKDATLWLANVKVYVDSCGAWPSWLGKNILPGECAACIYLQILNESPGDFSDRMIWYRPLRVIVLLEIRKIYECIWCCGAKGYSNYTQASNRPINLSDVCG